MVAVLTKSTNDMKLKGMSFTNITFDEPSKIVKSGKELQATIAQHTEIKLSQGRLVSTSTLIAVSVDNGVNWTFIDTFNKDMATLRKAMPNLSDVLTIPPQQQHLPQQQQLLPQRQPIPQQQQLLPQPQQPLPLVPQQQSPVMVFQPLGIGEIMELCHQ